MGGEYCGQGKLHFDLNSSSFLSLLFLFTTSGGSLWQGFGAGQHLKSTKTQSESFSQYFWSCFSGLISGVSITKLRKADQERPATIMAKTITINKNFQLVLLAL
jgi:hypothetical protein